MTGLIGEYTPRPQANDGGVTEKDRQPQRSAVIAANEKSAAAIVATRPEAKATDLLFPGQRGGRLLTRHAAWRIL